MKEKAASNEIQTQGAGVDDWDPTNLATERRPIDTCNSVNIVKHNDEVDTDKMTLRPCICEFIL